MGEVRQPRYKDRHGIMHVSKTWWIRYYRNGKRHEESSHSTKKGKAITLLHIREGHVAEGEPITAAIGRVTFNDCAQDVLNDYTTNGKKSHDDVEGRIENHLTPVFGGRRMATITTPDVRAYTLARQQAGASNGTINRELTILRRCFNLAMQAGKLLHRPHVPLLREDNVRTGFFDAESFRAVHDRLPAALQPVVEFAYITGWRIPSEVLTLEWRQVDFDAEEVRLDAGKTKNGKGRVFPFTDELRMLLQTQHAEHVTLKKAGTVEPRVFFRMVAKGRRGKKSPKPITAFAKAWQTACTAAGCPGRIPHDLRRSAVRNMVRAGLSERVAMRLTGHLTPSVFARYDIVSSGDLRDAAVKLSSATGTEKGKTGTETAATKTGTA